MTAAFDTMGSMENDPLATYLEALARDDCYRVERVLKSAPHEVTEVVYFEGANNARLGPFVRKRIRCEAEMGKGYRHLMEAQRAGRRFVHLPRLYDVHERDGELVVVMEYVSGHTLRDEVYEHDPSMALAARWFPQLCDGVTELHELTPAPLIHRDLKPTNVLVSEAQLTIIDFGIARAFREGAEGDTTHFGTRSYAPPEQFGYGQTDERSDVYALGMILYYLLTERDPGPAVVRAGFPDAEIPPLMRGILARACAFDPQARFQSVRELKTAFVEAAERMERPAQAASAKRAGCTTGQNSSPAKPVPPAGSLRSAIWSLLGKIPVPLCRIWNGAIWLLWALMTFACFGITFFPVGIQLAAPFWYRVLEYEGFLWLGVCGIGYMFLDKRRLRKRLPALARPPFSNGFVFGGVLFAISAVVMLVCIGITSSGIVVLPSSS